jgi:hypothetical protein
MAATGGRCRVQHRACVDRFHVVTSVLAVADRDAEAAAELPSVTD